jgi:hypothetical protein
VVPAGSGLVQQPAWLAEAADVAVESNGNIYLLKGMNISIYDGTGETPVADLASAGLMFVNDMEVSSDGAVYVTGSTGPGQGGGFPGDWKCDAGEYTSPPRKRCNCQRRNTGKFGVGDDCSHRSQLLRQDPAG